MIKPECLCTKHLNGEHGEIHKHKHNFEKKHNMSGRFLPIIQIEPASMKKRHDALAEEINRRNKGGHKSPYEMPDISHLPENQRNAKVDLAYNILDLSMRCEKCAELIKKEYKND